MIAAHNARKLAEESDAEFKSILNKVGEKVEAAARDGLFALNLSQAFASWDKFQCTEPKIGTRKPELTDFQKKLMQELRNMGYGYQIKPYTYKEGGGLGCIDPEDYSNELKTGYHLVIAW